MHFTASSSDAKKKFDCIWLDGSARSVHRVGVRGVKTNKDDVVVLFTPTSRTFA